MSIGCFATKLGMTRIFDETGNLIPVTLLEVGLNQVNRIKRTESDGYNAIQVAYSPNWRYNTFDLKKINKNLSYKHSRTLAQSMSNPEYNILRLLTNNEKNENILKKRSNTKFALLTLLLKFDYDYWSQPLFKRFGEFRVSNPDDYIEGQLLSFAEKEHFDETSKLALNFKKGEIIRVTSKSSGKGFAGNQKRHGFARGPMTHGSRNHRLPGSIGAGTTPGRVYPGKKMPGRCGHQVVTFPNTRISYVFSKENILALKGSIPGKIGSFVRLEKKINKTSVLF
jgi:large subunit ribosomal protein L3